MSYVLQVLEKIEKVPSTMGSEHHVLVNPSKDELKGMESRVGSDAPVRYIIDKNKDYYIWHAPENTHNDMARHLGISANKFGPYDDNQKGNSSFTHIRRYNYNYRLHL
jgi:hypothetical protein